jgi:hypothetical protein
MNLGLCQAGNETMFQKVIDGLTINFPTGVTYAEIGVGSGGTLLGVADRLKELFYDWRVIGIDLPEGYSLCAHSVVNACAGKYFMRFIRDEVKDVNSPQPWHALANGITLAFAPSQAFFRVFWPKGLPLHCVLIDGCHGRACVTGDFLAVEPLIEENGYVIFHDFEVLGEPQPHCGIEDTLGACDDLRLTPTCRRRGWKFIGTSSPDKSQGGRAIAVFQKIPYGTSFPKADTFHKVLGT